MLDGIPDAKAFSLCMADLYSSPGKDVIEKFSKHTSSVGKEGGIKGFLNLQDRVVYVSPRDNMINDVGPSNSRKYSLDTPNGRIKVTPVEYAESASVYKPDLFACLSVGLF